MNPTADYIVVALISIVVSFVSGMIGIGGAVLLIPAYYFLPPIFGAGAFDMRMISGMTSLQVFFGTIASLAVHRKRGSVHPALVLTLAAPMVFGTLTGALYSAGAGDRTLIGVFAVLALTGAGLILFARNDDREDTGPPTFNRPVGVASALLIGFFGGMVGAPGAFLISPVMIAILRIPTRITIGSTLGIVLFSALAASIGKIATAQVPYLLTCAAVLGAVAGSLAGSRFSHRISVPALRRILASIIALAGLAMWYRFL